MVAGPGIERNEGMLGFDWVTHKNDPQPADADLNFTGLLPPDVNDLRDRFDVVEGLSGWQFNDRLRGDDFVADDMEQNELNAAGIARIAGLSRLLSGATAFTGGNIILGGAGSDLLEGRGGNDLLDGDAWLNVQLEAPDLERGGTKLVDSMTLLRTDVFAGTLNPGSIVIRRSIVVTGVSSADIDTAVFSGALAEYSTVENADGSMTITHLNGGIDGVDRLRNIERLQFTDQTIEVSTNVMATVPDVVGSNQGPASTSISGAGLVLGAVTVENNAVPAGRVIRQSPAANESVPALTPVDLVVSIGPSNVLVPSVVGEPEANARTAIEGADLRVGTVTRTSSTTVASGNVISQNPSPDTSVAPGSLVSLVISLGAPNVQVPGLIGLLDADATNAITTAGLTLGSITRQNNDAVPADHVISQSPEPEASVQAGTAVNLVVSLGPVMVPGTDLRGGGRGGCQVRDRGVGPGPWRCYQRDQRYRA